MQKKIQIKNKILRYLGHRGQRIDSITDNIIDGTIDEIKSLVKVRYTYKEFKIASKQDRIILEGADLNLAGEDIKNHLKDSKLCILMAVSLGHEVDTRIRYYEKIDMTRALILDTAATSFIEEVCDSLCEEIEGGLDEDEVLTYRYSPGYGDLPLETQHDFLKLLDTQKSIGLTVSSNSILIPRKSVTAIMGVVKKAEKKERKCIDCKQYSACEFTRG